MRIEIQGVNMSVSDRLKEQIEGKLSKFHRYFGDEALCTVKIQPEHDEVKLELTIKIRRDIYRAEALAPESQTALDIAVNNLEGQIRKHKSKMKKQRRDFDYLEEYLDTLPDMSAEEEESSPRITRRKRFVINPMDPEEAAMQMELIDHDFFIYLSPESGKVAVLYKRHDGDYGILEPEY